MTVLSEKEIEQLNALADDELDHSDKRYWLERLEQDEQAQEVFNAIVRVKSNMGAFGANDDLLKGEYITVSSEKKGSYSWMKMAASFLFAACFGGLALFFFAKDQTVSSRTAFEWHKQFSKKSYKVQTGDQAIHVLVGQEEGFIPPDLKPSQLYLVDYNILQAGPVPRAVLHYAGRSSCRLTIWYGSGPLAQVDALAPGLMIKDIQVEQRGIRLIAKGMDEKRFASIVAYIKGLALLPKTQDKALQMAMRDAYKASQTCS